MLKVDEIQNGVVIDHITAGTGLALYHLMELEKLSDASVALLQNVRSQKSGKKDIIKIEGDVSGLSFDILWTRRSVLRSSRMAMWRKRAAPSSPSAWSMSSSARTRGALPRLRKAVTIFLR